MTPETLASIHGATFTQSRPWRAAEFESLCNDPHCLVTHATVGFALIRVVADEAELLTIAIHPDHQRQGIADKLMTRWHQDARDRGATRAFLEVAADNNAAKALYEKHGYVQVGRRPGYYSRDARPAVDAIVMQRPL